MMPSSKADKRLILGIFSETGMGKTHLGLTALGPTPEKRIATLDFGNSTTHFDARPDVPEFDVAHIDPSRDPEAQVLAEVSEIKKHLDRYAMLFVDDFGKAWSALCDLHPTKDGKPVGFGDWKDIRPKHRRIFNAILSVPLDIILAFRETDEYEMEGNRPKRVRSRLAGESDTEYEPDMIIHLATDQRGRFAIVTKADRHGIYKIGHRIDNPNFPTLKTSMVGGHPAQAQDVDVLRTRFIELINWSLVAGMIPQADYNTAMEWQNTANAEKLTKQIGRWEKKKNEAPSQKPQPPNGKPRDSSAMAEHICATLEDDLALGHAKSDLLDILLKHPSLENQKEHLKSHFSQAQGDPGIETATLYEARRMILAATEKPHVGA